MVPLGIPKERERVGGRGKEGGREEGREGERGGREREGEGERGREGERARKALSSPTIHVYKCTHTHMPQCIHYLM